MACYRGYDLAIIEARDDKMIVSFLILTLFGIGMVMFWIVWWLVADLFSGTRAPIDDGVISSKEKPQPSSSSRRVPTCG